MTASWSPPLLRQVKALLDQFLLDPPALIGTESIERLERTGRLVYNARLEPLGNLPMTRAFVWVQGADPQLWVDPSHGDYRGLYDQFARERLGLSGRPPGDSFNIDHVFPKTAGILDGLSHVRALAISAVSNQSAGRTVEKVMARRARVSSGRKVLRSATWVSIGKAAGFPGWAGLPDDAGNQALVAPLFAYLASIGIAPPAGGIEVGMTSHMLERIR